MISHDFDDTVPQKNIGLHLGSAQIDPTVFES